MLTIDDFEATLASQGTDDLVTNVARLMRIVSEDVIEALQDGSLPFSENGRFLEWKHPNGMTIKIAEDGEDFDDTNYEAIVTYNGTCIRGGFALHDEDLADLLDAHIECDFDD